MISNIRTIAGSHTSTLQTRLAHELHERCSVPITECGLSEVKQFQTHLTEYQINVVSKEHQNSIIFAGPEAAKRIYLYCHENHYAGILCYENVLSHLQERL